VEVLAPTGIDQDGDGMPDWYGEQLYEGSSVAAHSATSAVSPFFIEGTIAQAQDLSSGQGSAVTVNGTAAQVFGQHNWYANVTLSETENEVKLSFPDGRELSRNITWTTTNILENQSFRLRSGDTLKLAAFNVSGDSVGGRLRIDNSSTIQIPADQPYQHTFTDPGHYKLIGRSKETGARARINVEVVKAGLPQEIATVLNEARDVTLPNADFSENLSYSGSAGLIVEAQTDDSAGNARLRLLPGESGQLALAARLHENGPIVSTAQVPAITIVNSLTQQSTLTLSSGAPNGYYRLHAPLVVLNLPEGAYVEISIFRTGVIFPDGSTEKRLYASDFEDGLVFVDFLFPGNLSGGYCHHLSIYDRDGVRLYGH